MKEKFCSWYNVVLTTLVLAVSLTACSSSDDDDGRLDSGFPANFPFSLSLEDADGHDLGDTAYVDNVLNKLSAVYMGKVYNFEKYNKYEEGYPMSPKMVGLTYDKHYAYDKTDKKTLIFGYFKAYNTSEKTEFLLNLDGKPLGTFGFVDDNNPDDPWKVHFYFKAAGSETEQAVKSGSYRLLITPQGSAELLQAY